MAKVKGIRERVAYESPCVVVGDSRVLQPGEEICVDATATRPSDQTFVVMRLRIDAMIDDLPGGRAFGWGQLLRGLRVSPAVGVDRKIVETYTVRSGYGERLLSPSAEEDIRRALDASRWRDGERHRPWTEESVESRAARAVESVLREAVAEVSDAGSPEAMCHGTVSFAKQIYIYARQPYGVRVAYEDAEPVPLGFLRVVFVGVCVRDIA